MEKPRLMREISPAGAIVSVRYRKLKIDYMRKERDFTLFQFGRERISFLLRLHTENRKPPIFLFDVSCRIKWVIGRYYIGTTMQPILLDKYWRTKGWDSWKKGQSMSTKAITNGSEGKPVHTQKSL